MAKETSGVIYILTNPSFPDYVKIGYANNMDRRLAELNRTECTPFAFRVYATYEVESNLSDKRVHEIIDRLNPNLRAIEDFDGRQRKREFYAMSKEDAFSLLSAIAAINGRESKLKICAKDNEAIRQEKEAKQIEVEMIERRSPFSFDKCDIVPGETIHFSCPGNAYDGEACTVIDNKHIRYKGEAWSLSALATALTEGTHTVAGPCYYKYKGEWLNDIRNRKEGRPVRSSTDAWVIPCNPKVYDIAEAFKELNVIEWKQSTNVQQGDTVYIYVGGEYKAIMYKCVAEETEIYGVGEIDDSKFVKTSGTREEGRLMRLRLVETYKKDQYPLAELRTHGLSSVQGPSRVTADLLEFLE